MSKIISIITSLLISISALSQTASFARAYEFHLGYKETKDSEVIWSRGNEVDMLVVISDNTVKIYSSEIQEYRMVDNGKDFGTYTRYLAVDKSGLQCFLYLGTKDDSIYTVIEYGDYAWMYYLTPNN